MDVELIASYLPSALQVADLLGVLFFAVSGALLAARRRFDVVGSLLLASLAGLGGGVVRDVILDDGVPNAFARPIYLVPVVIAVLAVYLRAVRPNRLRRTLLVFDAAGLALFCVTGTQIALEAGAHPVSAVLLGTTTCVVGGLLRDVVANQVPDLFDPRGVYAVPALVGATLVAVLDTVGWYNLWAGIIIVVLVFTARVLALKFRWRVPGAALGQHRISPLTQPVPIVDPHGDQRRS